MQKTEVLQKLRNHKGKVLYVGRYRLPVGKLVERAANELLQNLAGVDLTGKTLSKSLLPGVDFSDAHLESSCFQGADLRNCTFSRAFMRSVDLRGADITGATFHDADLQGAHLNGTGLFQFIGLNEDCITIDLTNQMIYSFEWTGPVKDFSKAKNDFFPSTRKVIAAILDQAEGVPFTSKLLGIQ